MSCWEGSGRSVLLGEFRSHMQIHIVLKMFISVLLIVEDDYRKDLDDDKHYFAGDIYTEYS